MAIEKAWKRDGERRGRKIIYTGEIEREAAELESVFGQASKDRSGHVLVKKLTREQVTRASLTFTAVTLIGTPPSISRNLIAK